MAIKSKVDSKVKSDNQYIVIKRLVSLGQKVKKGTPLLMLRNQDLSLHYENRTLRSPVSGVVAAIAVSQGQYINKGENLILINDPENLYGKIEVSAADYKKIKPKLTGFLKVSSLNLSKIPLEVTGIGTAIDSLTGTVTVELSIKDPKRKLIPGVIGSAEIILNKEERKLINEKSLYYIGENIFVATIKDKKVKKVEVKIGNRFKEKIEILEGLELGQEYISEAAKFLRDGEEVLINKK